MTTEERLENLERELARAKRRNHWLLAAVLLGAGAVILAAAWLGTPEKVLAENAAKAKAPTVVIANLFLLEDENGKTLASLSAFKGGSVLNLSDENGTLRAHLLAGKDGAGLDLFDENGKVRAGLGVTKDDSVLTLTDENGKAGAMLNVDKDGPRLVLGDENGKTRSIMGAGQIITPDGRKITYPASSIQLFNPEGKVIWAAP